MLLNFDQLVYQQMLLIQRGWATSLMIFITNLFSPVTLPIFALLLVILLLYKKRLARIGLVVFGLVGGLLLESGLKILFARPRPSFGLVKETDFSFPSGHATLAIIFFIILIYCFRNNFKTRTARWFYIAINVFLCALVGFSRLYLGVHWFSDVIAGYLLGLLWFLVVRAILRKRLDGEA